MIFKEGSHARDDVVGVQMIKQCATQIYEKSRIYGPCNEGVIRSNVGEVRVPVLLEPGAILLSGTDILQ